MSSPPSTLCIVCSSDFPACTNFAAWRSVQSQCTLSTRDFVHELQSVQTSTRLILVELFVARVVALLLEGDDDERDEDVDEEERKHDEE